MALTAVQTPPRRHPWLETFEQAPVVAFGDLLAGYARIPPYERADAPDAARMLFRPLPPDDPARRLLGPAILGWLDQRLRSPPPARRPHLQSWVREVCEAFEIINILEVTEAAIALRRRFMRWNEWTARFVLAPSRDARAEYWRMLALTQPLVAESGAGDNPDALAPLWLEICAAADSTLPHRYLQIGLLGLRRLPGALDGGDTPWVAGLAHWAVEHDPSPTEFQGQWRALKPMYPRNAARWRLAVGSLLATAAFEKHRDRLRDKWRLDLDIAPLVRPDFSIRGHELRSPGPHDARAITDRIGEPWQQIEPRIDTLMQQHRRFLGAASDPAYFVRAIHAVGRALIQTPADHKRTRARKAQALAREGLAWSPNDRHLWSLWREALEAEGALEAAERIGWERVRRDPTDPDARNQLATLLAEALHSPIEAESLLRDTIAAFPTNVVARNQLAELLIATDRVPDAEVTVDAAFAAEATDGATYALRARLRAHRGETQQALATLREGIERFPDNMAVFRDYQHRLTAGQPLRLESGAMAPRADVPAAIGSDDPAVLDAARFGRLRRLRALGEADDATTRAQALAEIQAIFAEDPSFAYAELLAARHKLWQANAEAMPVFAVAFEQALTDKDKTRLDELAKTHPRLEALILVARALLGDEHAARTVRAFLNEEPAKHEARVVTILRNGLRPIFAAHHKSAPLVFTEHRGAIQHRLYDATEASLGDRLAAAA